MPYKKESLIAATDYNNFIGNQGTSAYNNIIDAQQKLGALYGIGYGDRGYGQTSTSLSTLSSGTIISAMPWSNLRSVIYLIGTHQGTDISTLPPAINFSIGQKIIAETEESTEDYEEILEEDYIISKLIYSLDAFRLNKDSINMTLTSASPYVSTNSWSDIMSFTLDISWPTEDEARYFFNSGGEIKISMEHPDTSSSQNIDWGALLSDIDTVSLSSHSTGKSGIGFIASTIGYYELTDTDQLIYTTASGLIPSSGEKDVYINAKRLNYTGDNGANGTGIRITIQLEDGFQPVSPDSVESGTEITFSHYKSTAVITGITSPTFTSPTFAYTGVPISPEEPDDPTDPSVPDDPSTLGLQPFWNINDKSGNISVINSGFTYRQEGALLVGSSYEFPPGLVRNTIGRSTGKFYVELLLQGGGWGDLGRAKFWGIGFTTKSRPNNQYLEEYTTTVPYNKSDTWFVLRGQRAQGWMLWRGDGTDEVGTVDIAAWDVGQTYDQLRDGQTLMIAADFSSNKFWLGYNGVWSAGGNPATGTIPAFSNLPSPIYIMAGNLIYQEDPNNLDSDDTPNTYAGATFKLLSDYSYPTPSGFIRGW